MEKNYLNKLAHKMDFKSQIPKEEMEWLCNKTRKINLKKNEYLLQAGEIPGYIGMNMSGLLRLFYIDSNGIEMTKHFCMENTLAMSYSAFVNQQESKFFIKAVEKTELVIFNYKIRCY